MSISDFSKIARQPAPSDLVIGQRDDNQRMTLREPLNPPGAWTKFKAALSSVPLLGQLGSLRQARQEVDSYPVKLAQYEVSNRQILAGFVSDLRQTYGDSVANMAMRDVNVADGAPLSQRSVKTALDTAEQAQKQHRAMNNMEITRFLESPLQGGNRRAGETDMTALFLERDLPLHGQASWQEALGQAGAQFVTQLTEGLCRSLPEHSRGTLSNAQISAAATQALDTYASLQATPDMTPERLESLLTRANEKSASGHQAVLNRARELAITDRMDEQLSRSNPGSMINRIAADVRASMEADITALGLPPPGLDLAATIKSIRNGISETVSFGMSGLAKELGCDNDTPSLARALDGALPGKIESALRQHVQALTLIQQSPTLSDGQKAELMALAQTRRFDPVQVQKYEAVAGAISDAVGALKDYAQGGGDAHKAIAQLDNVLTRFETDLETMKIHGATVWESGSLSGGDMTMDLMQQFANVAARSLGRDEAQALFAQVTGQEVATLAQVLQESPNTRTAGQLPLVLMMSLQAVAEQAGVASDAALIQVKALCAPSETGVDLGAIRPSLAMALLSDPETTDDRGVARGSANADLIHPDFDARTVIAAQRQNIENYVQSDPLDGRTGLPETTVKDMGRATFSINNQLVGTTHSDGDEVLARFQSFFTPGQASAARGVARCMNQLGINMFVVSNNSQAYGEGNNTAGTPGVGHTQQEAWQQPDGSWLVRSTHTQRPAVLARPDGTSTMIQSDGIAAYSLTYRVTPGAQPGDEALITVEDSQVSYAI